MNRKQFDSITKPAPFTPSPALTITRPGSPNEQLALVSRPGAAGQTCDVWRKRTATKDADRNCPLCFGRGLTPANPAPCSCTLPGEWELLTTCVDRTEAIRYGFSSAHVLVAFPSVPMVPAPLQALRRQVTGRIAAGAAVAITEQPAPLTVRVHPQQLSDGSTVFNVLIDKDGQSVELESYSHAAAEELRSALLVAIRKHTHLL